MAKSLVVHFGPEVVPSGPMVLIELERIEALELMGMVVAHLNVAETSAELSPRVATLLGIRDKLAAGLREDL